jgi:hypothetical protein
VFKIKALKRYLNPLPVIFYLLRRRTENGAPEQKAFLYFALATKRPIVKAASVSIVLITSSGSLCIQPGG